MPEEPVTSDELARQIRSHINRETFVGGKRVTRQELPELPEDAATTVHRVKVSLYGAKPRSGGGSRFPEFGDLFTAAELNQRLAGLATVLIPAWLPSPEPMSCGKQNSSART